MYYELLEDGTIGKSTNSLSIAQELNLTLFTEKEIVFGFDGKRYFKGEEPSKPDAVLAEEKRADRDRLLNDSDKRMLPDFPISAEEKELWLLYRQYLRDITKDPAFPNVDVLNFTNWLGQIHSKEPVLGVE